MSLDVPTIESGVWTAVKRVLGSDLAEAAGRNERLIADLGMDSGEVAAIVSDVEGRLHLGIDTDMVARHAAGGALSDVTIGVLLDVAVDTARGDPTLH